MDSFRQLAVLDYCAAHPFLCRAGDGVSGPRLSFHWSLAKSIFIQRGQKEFVYAGHIVKEDFADFRFGHLGIHKKTLDKYPAAETGFRTLSDPGLTGVSYGWGDGILGAVWED